MTHVTWSGTHWNWRGYKNDGAEPTTAWANENTQFDIGHGSIARMRWNIWDSAGAALANTSLEIQYSVSGVDSWSNIGSPTTTEIWRWTNASGTHGNLVTSYKLTDSNESGTYHEYFNTNDYDHSSGTYLEVDCAIENFNASSGVIYQFRLVIAGNIMPFSGTKIPPFMKSEGATAPPSVDHPDQLIAYTVP